MSTRHKLLVALVALAAMMVPLAASAAPPGGTTWTEPHLGAASGSAIGPGGALYVPQPAAGEIWRIDPRTGETSLFASGLPQRLTTPPLPFGGVMDVAFIGSTAYALVSVVGNDFLGCHSGIGIYRIDGLTSSTLVADIGLYECVTNRPPTGLFDIAVLTGVQFALEPFHGGFLVTDGHHNRVLYVTLDGTVSVVRQFGDVVPTGLAVRGNTIYLAEAGPVPHLPQNGRVVSFEAGSSGETEIARGAPLLVDVERGRGQTMFALAQGMLNPGDPPGSPAQANMGSLVMVNGSGGFTSPPIADHLNQPSSLEIIGNTAYVVTLGGDVVKIDDIAGPPYG
jgi:hypothetical protein